MAVAPSAGPLTSLSVRILVEEPFGQPGHCAKSKHHSATGCPLYFFIFFTEKVMKKIKKIEQAASRWWYLLVGIRWQRMQWRIGAFYHQRAAYPWVLWRAAGCPPQFI